MKMKLIATMVLVVVSMVLTDEMRAAPESASRRDQLGRKEKFRILVDKVITDKVTEDEKVKQIAQAGFNVIVPRYGGEYQDSVRATARRAGEHGIYSIAWLRGTLHLYDKGEQWDRQRMTWPSGFVQDFYSPNMDRLWEVLTRQILGCARISVEQPALLGVFLDYENYWDRGRKGIDTPKKANAYDLSYDMKILGEFAAANKIDLPDLKPSERYPWLVERGLHDKFAKFQIDSWRARCRKLRQQVDAINPQFQIFIYPRPMETLFMEKAAIMEWATAKAPIVIGDWLTYGRPEPKVLSQEQALISNRNKLAWGMEYMRKSNVPYMYMSGIDPEMGGYDPEVIPALKGTDPEFCGRNAVMISQMSDGYWVFYEGPTYGKPDHKAYMEWLTRANRAIVAGDYGFWRGKRETPDLVEFKKINPKTNKIQVGSGSVMFGRRKMIEQTGKFEVHPLEGGSLKYLRQFDIVALKSFTVPMQIDEPFPQVLRKYVEQGGGLFLGFDTDWFIGSPFPEIAVRNEPTHEKVEVQILRHTHVIDTDLEIAQQHPALGDLQPGARFTPVFREHMIFKPGLKGTVVIRNEFGDPVYVVGTLGKGRVVISGSYYDRDLEGIEKQVLLRTLNWLAGAEGTAHTAR